MKHYRCTLKALSPIHIGATEVNPACRYVMDPDGDGQPIKCLKESYAVGRLRDGRLSVHDYMRKPAKPTDLPRNWKEYVLYELDTTAKGRHLDKEARPFIRNAFGKAYLPGSSLKGMLRQALAFSLLYTDENQRKRLQTQFYHLLEEMRHANKENIRGIRRKDKTRMNTLEGLFRSSKKRPDPKNDIMRAIRVSDSEPSDRPLVMAGVNIFTARGDSVQVLSRNTAATFCEVVEPGAEFRFDLDIDVPLLEQLLAGNPAIRFSQPEDILAALEDHAQVMNIFEKDYLQSHGLGPLWDDSYENPGDGAVTVRLGWGSGWTGATLFPILAYDPENDSAGRPLSRKFVVSSANDPNLMLGWAAFSLKEAS
jgi:CRISPR-associated protein Csm5